MDKSPGREYCPYSKEFRRFGIVSSFKWADDGGRENRGGCVAGKERIV
jgi:hypothetical protein